MAYYRIGALKKTAEGYIIPVPRFTAENFQLITWASRDIGEAVLALTKNYSDPSKGVLGKTFPVITARMTYHELAKSISTGIPYFISVY
jgi:hypothetical protein